MTGKGKATLAIALLAACLASGCSRSGPVEHVKIVGVDGYVTVVEFPDGTRIARFGVWGKVGDEMSARRLTDRLDGDETWR